MGGCVIGLSCIMTGYATNKRSTDDNNWIVNPTCLPVHIYPSHSI